MDKMLRMCFGLIIANKPSLILKYILGTAILVMIAVIKESPFDFFGIWVSLTLWSIQAITFYYLFNGPRQDHQFQDILDVAKDRITKLLGFYLVFIGLALVLLPFNSRSLEITRAILEFTAFIYLMFMGCMINFTLLSEAIKKIPDFQSLSPATLYPEVRTFLLNSIISTNEKKPQK